MKIEINDNIKQKIKETFDVKNTKSIKRRNILKKSNINKSYYVLLVFMVGLASLSFIGKNKMQNKSIIDKSVAPVISDSVIKQDDESQIICSMPNGGISPISKENIISYEYTGEFMKIETVGDEKVINMIDGIVENIYLDYSYGYTVIISNDEGIRCKYANLDSNIYVKLNQEVKAGDVIGRSVDYDLLDTSFVYVTFYYNNQIMDITDLFKM